MEFRLLGPVEMTVDGQPVEIGRRRERALLSLLLLEVGKPVSATHLIDMLWEDDPPPSARKSLQIHVSRLRSRLAELGRDNADSGAVLTSSTDGQSYTAHTDPDLIDAHRFSALVAAARQEWNRPHTQAQLLRHALALWRGPALADVGFEAVRRQAHAHLHEARLAAQELRVDAELALGRHHELVAELAELTVAHPTRERLVAAHMRALYHCDRAAEALELYQHTSAQLAERLGIDPGPQLRNLYTAILQDDLDRPPTVEAEDRVPPSMPRQLPADIIDFTGRRAELASVRALVQRDPGHAPFVCVIHGMGGVGKTRLAVHIGHQLVAAGHGQHGQLFVDLRGFAAEQDPADPGEVLGSLLLHLGIPQQRIPADSADRAIMFREQLSGAKILILLDNAADEQQLLPLLPASPECMVIITSRRNLSVDGAVSLPLDVFPEHEALEYVTASIGTDRAAAEPDAVAELLGYCGRLPIAVALAAHRLRARPAWHVHDLVVRLRKQNRILGELTAGRRAVRSVLELSYQALPQSQAEMFRMLGIHPGNDVTAESMAVLADITLDEAESALEALLDEHLLQQPSPNRYRAHDLVRAHAQEAASEGTPPEWRSSALRRLLRWHLRVVSAIRRVIDPHNTWFVDRDLPEPHGAERHLPDLSEHSRALDWCVAERLNLAAAIHAAVDAGEDELAWRTAAALGSYFNLSKNLDDWISTNQTGVHAARRRGDVRGEAYLLNGMGVAHSDKRDYLESIACHEAAERLFQQAGDRLGEAWNLNNLGVDYDDLGQFSAAVDCYQRALVLFQELDHAQGVALIRNNLGDVCRQRGEVAAARAHLTAALELQQSIGDTLGQRFTLTTLGDVHRDQGERDQAIANYQSALTISRDLGDQHQIPKLLIRIGRMLEADGPTEAARAYLEEAHTILDELGDQPRAEEVRALLDQGLT